MFYIISSYKFLGWVHEDFVVAKPKLKIKS